jgi:mannose-6-phosphate isomerase-like protein (cupin superfamily)
MAQVITQSKAKDLGLPGRKSLEIISGMMGAQAVTLRLVEIPVPQLGETLRGKHYHTNYEECIYVLSGQGCTETDIDKYPLIAGDTILIPAGEAHVTRNTGSESLMLLCFFPTAKVNNLERNQP